MQEATTERTSQAHTEQHPRAAPPPRRGWTWSPSSWKWQTSGDPNKSSQTSPTAATQCSKKRAATLSINDHELTEQPQHPSRSASRFREARTADARAPMPATPKAQEDLELRRQKSIQVKRGEMQERLDREDSDTCECRARAIIL